MTRQDKIRSFTISQRNSMVEILKRDDSLMIHHLEHSTGIDGKVAHFTTKDSGNNCMSYVISNRGDLIDSFPGNFRQLSSLDSILINLCSD